MDSILQTLEDFQLYLTDPKAKQFTRLQYYRKNSARLHHDFYTLKIRDNPDWEPYLHAILTSLQIPPRQWGRYTHADLTVNEFLKEVDELIHKRNTKLRELLDFLDVNNLQTKRRINLLVGGSILVFAFLPPAIIFLGDIGLSVLQSLLAISLFVPAVSIVYTVGIALYSMVRSYYDEKISWEDRFRESVTLLASSAFNIAAYSILIVAAATFNPIAAAFFVVASVISVVNEAVHLIQLYQQPPRDLADTFMGTELAYKQETIRSDSQRTKQKAAVAISFGAAVVMAGIIAAWCFVPGGIFVSIAAVAAIALVTIVKYVASSYVNSSIDVNLNKEFEVLEKDDLESERLAYKLAKEQTFAQNRTLSLGVKPATELESQGTPEKLAAKQSSTIVSRPSKAGLFSVHTKQPTNKLDDSEPKADKSSIIH